MRRDGPDSPPPILPPRPNPGPEPWPEAVRPSLWWLLVPAAPVGLLACWWYARRVRIAGGMPEVASVEIATPTSASERLIHLVDRVRDATSRHFGPAWAAMTTEEIAEGLARERGFGPDLRAKTFAYLLAADRIKFAGSEIDEDHLAEAEAWAAEFLDALGAAGARSTQNGR